MRDSTRRARGADERPMRLLLGAARTDTGSDRRFDTARHAGPCSQTWPVVVSVQSICDRHGVRTAAGGEHAARARSRRRSAWFAPGGEAATPLTRDREVRRDGELGVVRRAPEDIDSRAEAAVRRSGGKRAEVARRRCHSRPSGCTSRMRGATPSFHTRICESRWKQSANLAAISAAQDWFEVDRVGACEPHLDPDRRDSPARSRRTSAASRANEPARVSDAGGRGALEPPQGAAARRGEGRLVGGRERLQVERRARRSASACPCTRCSSAPAPS